MHTIYADVLIVLNIYVNFILILTVAKITHSKLKKIRAIIASVYGSLYSLMILLPEIPNVLNIAIKFFAASTIIVIAFGMYNKMRTVINIICFFMANFIFGGVIFAVYIWLKPSFIHFNNTYFYIDFSLLLLIFVTAFLYTALSIFQFFLDRTTAVSSSYRIIVKYRGRTAVLNALADTGNSLVDFFSGKPVIICSYEKLSENINLPDIKRPEDYLKVKGFRLIPYSTIGNSGMIPVFTPDEVLIINEDNEYRKKADALIGIKSTENKAIFNPQILKL